MNFNDERIGFVNIEPVMTYVNEKYWAALKSWVDEKGTSEGFDDWFLALVKNRL